jgi:carotenoid cleavage dioxygenase-like enzyme
VIDPNQSLVTAIDSEQLTSNDKSQDDSFYPIHYINTYELDRAIQECDATCENKFSNKVRRIRDMIKDTPDMLFKVQQDGSLTIWGIQVS